MKTLKILTAAILASFAVAAQAGPYGPGPGCPAGTTPGTTDCPAFGPGGGPGRGGPGMQERLKAADRNADGMISREEAQASLPRLYENFDAIDANKDGLITFEEMRGARLAHRGGGARGEGWKKWDANADGKLSREEVASAPRLSQEFNALDANKDGFLTFEELQAARGRYAGRGRPS